MQHVPSVLLPDWEKEKDKNVLKKSSDEKVDKSPQEVTDSNKTVQVSNFIVIPNVLSALSYEKGVRISFIL